MNASLCRRLSTCLVFLASTLPSAFAEPPSPVYPQVNPAPWFEVDPNWPQKPAEFTWGAVAGVAVDKDDNVWIYTRATPSVQVYAPDGKYLFGWGDGTGAHHIAIDKEGFVWTTDFGRHVVEKHDRDGKVLLTLGVSGEAGTDESHFFRPTDVAIASNGDLFVSDGYGNARIVHFTKEGKFVKAWGSLGVEAGQFSIPHSIEVDSKGRLYVADRNNARVQVYAADGALLDSWKSIAVPWSIWITENDDVWICGSSPMPWQQDAKYPNMPLGCPPKDQLIMRFNTEGKLLQLWGIPKGEDGNEKPGELNWVHCIALDSQGTLYLGDIQGKRVQRFLPKR